MSDRSLRTPTVSLLSLLQVPSRDEAYFSSVAPSVLCCLYFHPVYRHSLLARNGKKGAIFDLKVLHELLLLAKGEEPVAENRILTVVVLLPSIYISGWVSTFDIWWRKITIFWSDKNNIRKHIYMYRYFPSKIFKQFANCDENNE